MKSYQFFILLVSVVNVVFFSMAASQQQRSMSLAEVTALYGKRVHNVNKLICSGQLSLVQAEQDEIARIISYALTAHYVPYWRTQEKYRYMFEPAQEQR